jgi:hypothetical protein
MSSREEERLSARKKFVGREENHLVFVEEVQKEFIGLLG